MNINKKSYLIPLLVFTFFVLLISGNPSWSKPDNGLNLNLTPDQVKSLETVTADLIQKQFEINSNIERTLLELKLELQREDRFATEAKLNESAQKASQHIKRLSSLYGDMLKLEVSFILKSKDVLTKEQRRQLVDHLDFEVDAPEGWAQNYNVEVLIVDLELTEEQLNRILTYKAKMRKKEAKIEQKMETLLLDLEDEMNKDMVDDKKVNKIILTLTDIGIEYLNDFVENRLKTIEVLNLEQRKKLLHLLFIASGF